MIRSNTKQRVYVGLSGGVDSSVSAKRLIDARYDVVGVFIKTWQPDFLVCNWEAERLDAMRVAAHLDIPFHTFDAVDAYRDEVAQYMIAEYSKGRTPNPDVMCNKSVKFGAFLNHAMSDGVPYVATGHYARVTKDTKGYHLLRGIDASKDQSYFLWTLTQSRLAHTLFPVGDTAKDEIRNEARKYGLKTSNKQDSQGICFLGDIDITEFLSHYIHVESGAVLNTEGNVVGTHKGALFYTLGQRHGFTVTTTSIESTPHYVVAKDMAQNTITVSTEPPYIGGKKMVLTECNFIQAVPTECAAQFRYRQKPFPISFTQTSNDTAIVSVLDEDIELPSVGQSCVLYRGDECLGGGIIDSVTE